MNNIYYIYAYLDPRKPTNKYDGMDYEPFYIGRGSRSRFSTHLTEAKNIPDDITMSEVKRRRLNMIKINKIKKIIREGHSPIIIKLHENLSMDESKLLEVELISTIGRSIFGDGPLVNLTNGGEGRHICHSGRFNPFYGKTHSDEFKAMMSSIHKGKTISDDHKATLRDKLTGKKKPHHQGEALRSHYRALYESDPNHDTFQRLGRSRAKTWVVTGPDGTEYIVTSLRAFALEHGLNVKTLMSAYNNNRPTITGWFIKLVEN